MTTLGTDLPLSRTGHDISQIKSSFEGKGGSARVWVLNLDIKWNGPKTFDWNDWNDQKTNIKPINVNITHILIAISCVTNA